MVPVGVVLSLLASEYLELNGLCSSRNQTCLQGVYFNYPTRSAHVGIALNFFARWGRDFSLSLRSVGIYAQFRHPQLDAHGLARNSIFMHFLCSQDPHDGSGDFRISLLVSRLRL
jgi:hypothetical protein